MAQWLKTMDEQGVLCRVKVSSLDRAYRNTRDVTRELAKKYPEEKKILEQVYERVHQLYTDAHENSPGVPLSHRQFEQIGTSQLPSWAKE